MPCQGPAVKGAEKCRMHLGKKTTALKVEREAERLLYRRDATPVDNPLEALQSLAGRALALEQTIGGIVNDLSSLRYGNEGGEHLRAEVAVLERAMDRCGRLLVDIAKLNIDERLARIGEQQANLITAAVVAVLDELGLSPEQQTEARRGVARHLRAV